MIDAKSKDLIPYVDETAAFVAEIHTGKNEIPSGNITEKGVKKPYLISAGSDSAMLASVWEEFFDEEEALRLATHEITHAIVLEQNNIDFQYIFYITKTRDGQDVVGAAVYFEFPKDMPEKQQAEIGLKVYSAVEDPSAGDLSQIEYYKSILQK